MSGDWLSLRSATMHCDQCGSYVDDDARFCKQCGAAVGDAEETRIAAPQKVAPISYQDNDDDVEHVIFTARPTLIFVKLGYALAVLGAIALTILFALIPHVPWYFSLPVSLALLLIPAYYHLKRNMIRYTVTDSKIEIDHGLIARTTRNIPLSKIQDVTISASILQRILGFGDVVVDNASEIGGTTILHNINNPRQHADLLLRELRRWH
jgi:membrane protein YdbS with pleckstrin-like domain